MNDGSGGYWALDNMTVNGTSPVPEPATWLLMGTGLFVLPLLGLRRKWAMQGSVAGNPA